MTEHAAFYRAAADAAGLDAHPDVPLGPYTTMKVGGPASWLYAPRSKDQAARIFGALCNGPLPVRILGAGSNVLVADCGIRAAVIATSGLRGDPTPTGGDRVVVQAGSGVPGIVRWTARHGLTGFEFAEGIPAKLGGAVRMNAGANDSWLSDVVTKVHFADRSGRLVERTVTRDDFDYRSSFVARERVLVLGAELRLVPDDPERILTRIREFKGRRRRTQPLWERSSGCIFANWPDQPVGALVERLGLKGTRIGDAEVSDLHGNFIVNRGAARAEDVISLIDLLRERLARETGQTPRLEVEIWRDEG